MDGNLMYEIAMQRVAEQRRVAEQWRAAKEAGEARQRRTAARGRRAKAEAPEATALPVIPDFAHELLGEIPEQWEAGSPDATRGNPERAGR